MFDNILKQMQNQSDEVKKRLKEITLTGEAEDGKVIVRADGNKNIKDISISDDIIGDKEALEDLVLTAINRALAEAERANEAEMKNIARDILPPDIGNIFG